MLIRFTEFFKKDKEDISLYIIQESNNTDYTVHISNGNETQKLQFKRMWNRWSISTKNIPKWVDPFKQIIARRIEYRVIMGLDRLKLRFKPFESPKVS